MPNKAAKPGIDYQTLQTELDSVMAELQREDLDVDAALKHYQRGLELIQQLQQYLQTAENKVIELKAKFNDAAK
jgi:exodeoxyribonuclease VII small subunit